MRKPLIICIVLAIAGALTASLAMAASVTKDVKVGDNYFVRSTGVPKITIKQNTTVRFKFKGQDPHDVWGYRGTKKKFASDIYFPGDVWKKKMSQRGTFKIVCDIHGEDDQRMTIKVVRP